jgi:rubrerythrin
MSKTIDNLKAAFSGESMARNRYMFFAQTARKEGYHYIAKIFEETAENEMYHALEEYRLLFEEDSTAANLKEAIKAESYEAEQMYPGFAVQAEVEGDTKASVLFNQIAKIEKTHLERFKKLLELVETGSVYKREKPIRWKCSICGYTYEGHEPPPRCPYCKHAREYCEPANLDV